MENIYKVAYEMILEEIDDKEKDYSWVSIDKSKIDTIQKFVKKMTETEDKENG